MGPKLLPCDTDIEPLSFPLLLDGTNMDSMCILKGTTVQLSKHNIKKSKFSDKNAKNNDNNKL